MGPSLMRPGPAGLVARAVRGLGLGPVDLVVRDRADPAGQDLVDLVGLAVLDLVVRADPVDLDLAGRADPVGLVGLVDIRARVGPVVREDLGRADLVGRVAPVDQGMDLVGLVGRGLVGLVDQGMGRAGPVGRVDRDLAGRVAPVVRVDRQGRHTRHGVRSIGVAPRWAAPGTYLKASAHPVTVRRLRPHYTDGAGKAGLRPGGRRRGGTDRRPQAAGTVHRLPAVGTAHGTGRRVT